MTDLPIIFSGPMVRALLAGRKTMTRRLAWKFVGAAHPGDEDLIKKPSPWQKVKPGDRLWVKETHYRYGRWVKDGLTKSGWQRWRFKASEAAKIPDKRGVYYEDERDDFEMAQNRTAMGWHRRPSIFMPRWASRLTLIVTATKIERLQDISEEDAIAEGIRGRRVPSAMFNLACYYVPGIDEAALSSNAAVGAFRRLWERLHGPASWDANPEVVALTFKPVLFNIDRMKEVA